MYRDNLSYYRLMTTFSIAFISLAVQSASAKESIVKDNLSKVQIRGNIASMSLAFTANQGQWDEKVSFRASANGATMWFSQGGAYYQFSRTIRAEDSYPLSIVGKNGNLAFDDLANRQPDSIEILMIKASFVGANSNPQMIGIDLMEYKCNYFIGNDPNDWHTDVPNYSAVLYEQVYDGIDLKYYGNGTQMEYDFIVSPGADYSQIKIQYEGAKSIVIDDNGQLVVTTEWGKVVEQTPVIYQIDNNSRIAVSGEYKMMGDNSFGFELSSGYDPDLPLVIDPVLIYSTYLGGSLFDAGFAIAVDGSGNAYIIGNTSSANFPTVGEFQTDQAVTDAFVTKLNSSGNALVYSTYLGGSSSDQGLGIAVDGSGNAYLTGTTESDDFPTVGAYQSTLQGTSDVFVAKLNSTGNALVYSTYLGGNGRDNGSGIAVDGSGNAYITGHTGSTNFPTVGAFLSHQSSIDVFVTKLNSTGNALVYSTYLGGSSDDYGRGIAVDGTGNAYVSGRTSSPDFPTVGAYQSTFHGGGFDVFVSKLNSSGSALDYSTYLGENHIDIGSDIAVDSFGNAYITGYTWSTNFPTEGAFQAAHNGGDTDAFVTKLNTSGDALVYSTFLGGSSSEQGIGIAVDGSGNAYVTGLTHSTDFPTKGEYQTYQGGVDVFVTKLSSFGKALVYSTYLGGGIRDVVSGIAVDGFGNAFVTGWTTSTDFPAEGAYQTSLGGERDVFVTKFTQPPNCCDLPGDFDGNGIVAMADLLATLRWLFGGGVAPDCLNDADVDASCIVDLTDITYRTSYMFSGGPDLLCGCVE